MYTFDSGAQPAILLMSLGVGFVLGIVYDVFRAIRLTFTRSPAAIVVFDILYFAVFGFASFIFILAANKGEVRLYIILAEFVGAAVYYFSCGAAAVKLTDVFVKCVRKVSKLAYKVISLPFRTVFAVFAYFNHRIICFFKKSFNKKKKFLKKHLKKLRICVYNLFGVLCKQNSHAERNGNFEQK